MSWPVTYVICVRGTTLLYQVYFSWSHPQGVVYASLDFSKQQLGKKKALLEKKKEPAEVTIYSEIRQFTQLDEQQLKKQEAEDSERSHSPTTIM